MTTPITLNRDVESLKVAARWPGADQATVITLDQTGHDIDQGPRDIGGGLTETYICATCGRRHAGAPITAEDLAGWLAIGRANLWIRRAWDPPFTCSSFRRCCSRGELRDQLTRCSWSLGAAFVLDDACFINQVDGGDEWLAIRHGFAFESISWCAVIESGGFDELLASLLAATPEQCRTLTYSHAGRQG